MSANTSGIADRYDRHRTRRLGVLALGVLGLFAVGAVALRTGTTDISAWTAAAALTGRADPTVERVIWQIRLPRILGGAVAGAGLAYVGTAMQSVLRNPLGAPYTLGISQAAAFGAALSIAVRGVESVGGAAFGPYVTTASAFVVALSSTSVILLLIRFKNASPETLILTGVALGALFNAGITVIQYLASDTEVAAIVYWTFGDLGRLTWPAIAIMGVGVIASAGYFSVNGWRYTILDAGDETATSLGVPVERLRVLGMLVAAFATAIVISFVGIIGFVGLVAPHIARKLVGTNERILLPASGLVGAILLVCADTAARAAFAPLSLPVGVLTSFLGAPLFVYLVVAGREHW
ncbi:ABC-type Fe3+-siderophore transport system, permease component [Halanaeroarchaeum sp. HSR-CO]|uniref:FecCD family ABC transporter permease n=1 Tax=Halanaeroarchaeum sp. HSR-CO TaxID=2866382 RepID=UPI00217E6D3F|nr:iron ABC transporter permease [Halanaeroarchaeum sp. HSR-CO]UWG47164.1 ABC-type Fe3+-siderophore transport system, permease component [Halanaeroarchaeum sp. HSR-CO]